MDLKSEKSSVSQLNFDKLETASETKMWTVQSLTEVHLRELLTKFPDLLKYIIEKDIIPFINDNARIEQDDASISVIGPNNQRWKIISGHGKQEIRIDLTDINDPIITIKADDNNPEEMRGEKITKTFLGKCIIKKCGNEGNTKNESMRKLLQVAMYLPDQYEKRILKNAKVYIYDSMETLILVSGDGRNSFVINSENGNPKLKCSKSEKKYPSKIKLFGCSCLVLIGFTLILLFPCHFCVMSFSGFILWKTWKWRNR
ncbi:unnamed protein product [Mytilus coruscus]|uniref:Uncharacterized protein n=1 Tax=Mytilus coruscus TaxID=42192 RepID=A0A6J8E9Y4_MYTCO|nr:unnamed protein product [Mytilus coruscus]